MWWNTLYIMYRGGFSFTENLFLGAWSIPWKSLTSVQLKCLVQLMKLPKRQHPLAKFLEDILFKMLCAFAVTMCHPPGNILRKSSLKWGKKTNKIQKLSVCDCILTLNYLQTFGQCWRCSFGFFQERKFGWKHLQMWKMSTKSSCNKAVPYRTAAAGPLCPAEEVQHDGAQECGSPQPG